MKMLSENRLLLLFLVFTMCMLNLWRVHGDMGDIRDIEDFTLNLNYLNVEKFQGSGHGMHMRSLLDIGDIEIDDCYFFEGVASGDPSDTDIVLWTRVYCEETSGDAILVHWKISSSPNFEDISGIINYGITQTSEEIDFTVKIIADNLHSDSLYYYRFYVISNSSDYYYSDTGTTKTLDSLCGDSRDSSDSSASSEHGSGDYDSNDSSKSKKVSFGFGSCAMYPYGYWTNYGDLAELAVSENLDFMIWLGDYIYEWGDSSLFNGEPLGRSPDPADTDTYTLDHYRSRYKQAFKDHNLYKLRNILAWIFVWDDHEVVNDYYKYGSSWHDDDNEFNITFIQRKRNAYQAFYEYVPMREHSYLKNNNDINNNFTGLSKKYSIGNGLIDLFMVDARSQSTREADTILDGFNLDVSNHTLLGESQREWLSNELISSNAEWIIFASDQAFGRSPSVPDIFGRDLYGSGKFEGYNKERQIIIDTIIEHDIDNIIFIAGGPHTPVVRKIYSEFNMSSPTAYSIGIEIISDAIASPKVFEASTMVPGIDNGDYYEKWGHISPYIRAQTDGFQIMKINKFYAQIEFYLNDNIFSQLTHANLDATFCIFRHMANQVFNQTQCQEMLF